jgi:hypothetical protein
MALGSLFLPFLPLLAGQILLNNFCRISPRLVWRVMRWTRVGVASAALGHRIHRPVHDRVYSQFLLRSACFLIMLQVFRTPAEVFQTAGLWNPAHGTVIALVVVRAVRSTG